MANKEVEARLKITAYDRTSGVFSRIAERLGMVSSRANQVNAAYSRAGQAAQSAGVMFTRGLLPALAAVGTAKVIKDAAEVERQMNRIGITAGATAEETKAAGDAIRSMTKGVALSFQDGVEAIDTLTASGMDLKEAMNFLPAVLATTQATGAEAVDISNTALKTSSALKISAGQMADAFDLMAAMGKAGQFELKDMASFIPNLAPAFANLGYEGTQGLGNLLSVLQTLREATGDASSAATQASDIFGKMYSETTVTAFKKFGIDLRKQMDAAVKAGADPIEAFIKLSETALDDNMTKMPVLFTDKQFRDGMTSLLQKKDSYQTYLDVANSPDVAGTVDRDLQRVLGDSQASIDKMESEWDRFINKVGTGLAEAVTPVLNGASDQLDFKRAQDKYIATLGLTGDDLFAAQEAAKVPPPGWGEPSQRAIAMAILGGYQGQYRGRDINEWLKVPNGTDILSWVAGYVQNSLTEQEHAAFGDTKDWQEQMQRYWNEGRPLPVQTMPMPPEIVVPPMSPEQRSSARHGPDNGESPSSNGVWGQWEDWIGVTPADQKMSPQQRKAARHATPDDTLQLGAEKIREAGTDAGRSVSDSADAIRRAGADAASAIDGAAQRFSRTVEGAMSAAERKAARHGGRANVNTGQSMKPRDNAPEGAY
ncbi:phage tail tape measure protein [Martelella sp. HB161492]|uniref:phage tail tape measure protein n=1 Tax=Martelella sp. HB161492 TaxID=2720726 RepID=UPI001590065A|nr:phage tail tape measure protein [Martelella sp. HB161492]